VATIQIHTPTSRPILLEWSATSFGPHGQGVDFLGRRRSLLTSTAFKRPFQPLHF
jgi:hypothetical protein